MKMMERQILFTTFVKNNLSEETVLAIDVILKTDLTDVFNMCGISDWETNDRAIINSVSEFRNIPMSHKVKSIIAQMIRMKYFDLLVNRNGVTDYNRVGREVFNLTHPPLVRQKRVRFNF